MTSGSFSTPQGTVLSPVLYNLYVHQIYNLALEGQLVSYADDTAVCIKGDTWTEVFNIFKHDMQLLKAWFDSYNLTLNVGKTKILPLSITKPKLPEERSLTIHDENCNIQQSPCNCRAIDIVPSFKYLRVESDQHLHWESHINFLVKRMRLLICSFLLLRNLFGLKLLKEVYFALCQSSQEYAVCGYGRANKTALKQLNVTQNSIFKIIFRKDRLYSTQDLYKESKILNIHSLFTKNICSYIYKNIDAFSYQDHRYGLRRKKYNSSQS